MCSASRGAMPGVLDVEMYRRQPRAGRDCEPGGRQRTVDHDAERGGRIDAVGVDAMRPAYRLRDESARRRGAT